MCASCGGGKLSAFKTSHYHPRHAQALSLVYFSVIGLGHSLKMQSRGWEAMEGTTTTLDPPSSFEAFDRGLGLEMIHRGLACAEGSCHSSFSEVH